MIISKGAVLFMMLAGVLLFAVFFSFLGVSYGQIDSSLGDEIFVMVQTSVWDSDGRLVAYLESTAFTDIDYYGLDLFLDREHRDTDPIVSIDGKDYEVIMRKKTHVFADSAIVSSTMILDDSGSNPLLVRFAHDGYLAVPGDVLESVWIFVRPA